ncbi:alanine racemase [Rhodoligotrophos ferricapiens]|uniref:alanine racemase n=1 Tax=Rhodoligotrophos ferricapiens TaxID=3069264 RepID=UPI00315C5F72
MPHEVNARDAWRAGAVLEVDLGLIAANYRAMSQRYSGRTLSAVVKNDGYGLGLSPVVKTLLQEGCTHFWVRDLAEAMTVREIAPRVEIFTLHGLQGEDPANFATGRITPVLVSRGEVALCAATARRAESRLAVAIQLDTGLGRLGLDEADVIRLAEDRGSLASLEIKAWVSHLAAFDLPDAESNLAQRKRLVSWLAHLPAAPISLASSSGLFMGADWHFDIARVGSALYGVQTSTTWQDGLEPCYRLTAPILRVARAAEGATIGYRGITCLKRPSVIATAAIGYGNGLPQGFGRECRVRVAGNEVPIVGGIAMNLTMLDVTDLPERAAAPGERAVFLDSKQTVDKVAGWIGCAPNALLTQIGAGTRRAYLRDGSPVEV